MFQQKQEQAVFHLRLLQEIQKNYMQMKNGTNEWVLRTSTDVGMVIRRCTIWTNWIIFSYESSLINLFFRLLIFIWQVQMKIQPWSEIHVKIQAFGQILLTCNQLFLQFSLVLLLSYLFSSSLWLSSKCPLSWVFKLILWARSWLANTSPRR